MRCWALGCLVLAACVGHGSTPLVDASDGDAIGDAGCGAESLISGELIDWDSSTASFLGVSGATVTLVGDPTITTTTPTDGSIDLCARPDRPLAFTVDGPIDYLDGTLTIDRDVLIEPGVPLSLRTITTTRAATFFTEHSLTFDAGSAQIVVLLTGDRTGLTLDRTHDTTQAANDDASPGTFTWTAGNTGRYVLFPNVQVSGSTATIAGDPKGPIVVPIEVGKLSLVAISFVFL